MSRGVVEPRGTWIEFGGRFFYLATNFNFRKKGEGNYEAEGEGTSLPDPLLFQKKSTPPPLRQFPGLAAQNGPSAIGLISKNEFSNITYYFFDEQAGETLKMDVLMKGKAVRHIHKREFNIESGVVRINIEDRKGKREKKKKITYSPTSLDKKLEKLTEIRDSIQKEIEPFRV